MHCGGYLAHLGLSAQDLSIDQKWMEGVYSKTPINSLKWNILIAIICSQFQLVICGSPLGFETLIAIYHYKSPPFFLIFLQWLIFPVCNHLASTRNKDNSIPVLPMQNLRLLMVVNYIVSFTVSCSIFLWKKIWISAHFIAGMRSSCPQKIFLWQLC